jgi:hypothetical protein
MRGKEEMSHEAVVDKIVKMGQVVAILHTVNIYDFICFTHMYLYLLYSLCVLVYLVLSFVLFFVFNYLFH